MMLLTSSTTKEVYKESRILNHQWTHSSVYRAQALSRTRTRSLIYACQLSRKSEDTESSFLCSYVLWLPEPSQVNILSKVMKNNR